MDGRHPAPRNEISVNPSFSDTVILVAREGMGDAPPELRMKLLVSWCSLMIENRMLPGAICFYGEGVKVLAAGSPALIPLREMESQGVRLVVCKTCLDFFGLRDRLGTGIIGGMGDIQAATALARKVIAL